MIPVSLALYDPSSLEVVAVNLPKEGETNFIKEPLKI